MHFHVSNLDQSAACSSACLDALSTGQLGPALQQFGVPPAAVEAANKVTTVVNVDIKMLTSWLRVTSVPLPRRWRKTGRRQVMKNKCKLIRNAITPTQSHFTCKKIFKRIYRHPNYFTTQTTLNINPYESRHT